jgi:hypothetical protein
MDFSTLRPAITTISLLVGRASERSLEAGQVEELRTSVEALSSWPLDDPAFGQVRKLTANVYVSGILSSPSKRPTLPQPILSGCRFLLGYLDAQT